VHDQACIKAPGKRQGTPMGEINPDLGEIRTVKGSGMKVHQYIAIANDPLEKHPGDPGCNAAPRVSWEISVQVAAVRKITGTSAKTMYVDDWQANEGPRQRFGTHVIGRVADDLDAVELVSVNASHCAELGSRVGAVKHEYRHIQGTARKAVSRAEEQAP